MGAWTLIFTAAAVLAAYGLYVRGLAVSKSIAALIFVFQRGKNGGRFTLDSCTGWLRHSGRFRESRTYAFTFDCRLAKGEAEVLLLDRNRRELLRLDRHRPAGRMELDGKSRYYLRWSFKGASGKCGLRWQAV